MTPGMIRTMSRDFLLAFSLITVVAWNCSASAASIRSWVPTFQSLEHKCPTSKSDFPTVPNEIPIAWEQLSDDTATVQIKLENDGSFQRVFRRTFLGGHSQFEKLYLGPEGKDVLDEVTSNLYAGLDPFFAMEPTHLFDLKWHDSVSITKTKSHIYVVTWDTEEERAEDLPPLGTTFYLIKAGHLVPVCTFQPPEKESRRSSPRR